MGTSGKIHFCISKSTFRIQGFTGLKLAAKMVVSKKQDNTIVMIGTRQSLFGGMNKKLAHATCSMIIVFVCVCVTCCTYRNGITPDM